MSKQVTIYCSCFNAQEDENLWDKLKSQLKPLQISGHIKTLLDDRDIIPGSERVLEIDEHLNKADIILLLISPDFLASDFYYNVVVKRAMERHEQGEARVIPIILRHAQWQNTPLSKLEPLPKNAEPVTDWSNTDKALSNVAQGIQKAIDDWKPCPTTETRTQKPESQPEPIIRRRPIRKKIGIIGCVALVVCIVAILMMYLPQLSKANETDPRKTPTVSPSRVPLSPTGKVTSTITPGHTFTPQADPTPSPQTDPTPSQQSSPLPGNLLYSSPAPAGWASWNLSSQWHSNGSVLFSDAVSSSCSNPPTSILAEAKFSTKSTSNYAVEALMQVKNSQAISYFGIGVDMTPYGGFFGGLWHPQIGIVGQPFYSTSRAQCKSNESYSNSFTLDSGWHTYRLEIRGSSTVTFLIDGKTIYSSPTWNSPAGSQVGLIAYGCQIDVSRFSVYAL